MKGSNPSENVRRLVDKALEDYELVRAAFGEFANRKSNNVMSPLFRALGHMENCVGTVDRALRFVRRLREDDEFKEVAFPSSLTSKDTARRIGLLRNGTEHMDSRVIAGTVAEGDLSALWLNETYMELEGVRVQYSELGEWLTQPARVGYHISKVQGEMKMPPNHAPAGGALGGRGGYGC